MLIQDQRFEGGVEKIDGNEYVRCHFADVTMMYSGGDLPHFEACEFTRFRFEFHDAAERTVALLKAMSEPQSGFDQVFRGVFPPRWHV